MSKKRIAYWMSDKKVQKFNWNEFEKKFKQHGYTLFKLNLNENLFDQGTFCVFLHKLTDIIVLADQGDLPSLALIKNVEDYIKSHPLLLILDPLPNVRQLLNRYITYSKIAHQNDSNFFTPSFCELASEKSESELVQVLQTSNVTFPFISKPSLAHGSKTAHQMSIIFNINGLKDCKRPCVAQSFIPHNATLYKIFIVGERFQLVERPSIKNLDNASDRQSIHFDSADISKAGSNNFLNQKPDNFVRNRPNLEQISRIAETIRRIFGMELLGVDVVIENGTGKYAIIDINVFPGYDGYPDFYDALLHLINKKLNKAGGDSLP